MLGQHRNFGEILVEQCRVIGIDARNLVGINDAPVVLIHAASAHADESGFLRQPVLLRQEFVPRVPHFALRAGIGCGKRDMEAALEQPRQPPRSDRSD